MKRKHLLKEPYTASVAVQQSHVDTDTYARRPYGVICLVFDNLWLIIQHGKHDSALNQPRRMRALLLAKSEERQRPYAKCVANFFMIVEELQRQLSWYCRCNNKSPLSAGPIFFSFWYEGIRQKPITTMPAISI